MTSPDADTWVALTGEALPVGPAADWAVRSDCGGVVLFTGTVRDNAEGRAGVTRLEYEAYAGPAEARMHELAAEARRRWPDIGRVALLHRVGPLQVTEPAVVVVVSAPHRESAFEAARWCIDTLKATVPIWKKETWADGADWGLGASEVAEVTR